MAKNPEGIQLANHIPSFVIETDALPWLKAVTVRLAVCIDWPSKGLEQAMSKLYGGVGEALEGHCCVF